MDGNVVLKEPLPQGVHGRRAGLAPRRVLAGSGVGDDLGGPYTGIGRADGAVRSDGHLDDPAAVAGLDDKDLAPGGMDADAEAFDIMLQ